MRIHLLTCLLLCGSCFVSGQSSLENILHNSQDFSEIVARGNDYFMAKHPGRSPRELSSGQFRDGEYVKFQRWQHFWRERLHPDGTLADPSTYHRTRGRAQNHTQDRAMNPYANVPWTEVNYTDYITDQIGLGRTTSVGFHPSDVNTFYVGAAVGGIWKTTDAGQSWTPLGDDLPFLAVSAIVVDQQNPSTLYIAVSDHIWYGPAGLGVYKSTDGGSTWSPTSLGFTFGQDVRIYAMVANPANAQEMYVATANGLYKTTNGFTTNSRVLTGNCRDVRLRPGNAATVYTGMSDGRVMRSTDAGDSFAQTADFGNGDVRLGVSPLNDQLLYARNGDRLHLSSNTGTSFPLSRTMQENNEVFVIAPGSASTILSGNFECYRSDDDGANFDPITQWRGNNGLPQIHVDQRNMFVNPLENDAVYYNNDGGLYRYIISTNTFENLSDGLAITQYYDIAVAQTDANVIGGGSQDNGNVFRTAAGNWQQYAATGDGMNQEIDPTDAGIRYWAYQNGGIRRWQNGSNTNIEPPGVADQGAWETPYKIDPSQPSRLIVGYQKVWESTDRGNSWTTISDALDGGSNLNELAIAPANGERIYVTSGSNLYVKSVLSNSWTTRSLPAGSISDIEVDPLDINKVYVSVPGYGNGSKVYVSTDAGANWTNLTGSLPNVSTGALELYHDIPGAVFVGTDAGVFYRDDQLDDWLAYGDLPNTRVEDIEIQYAAGLLRVGTHGRGILEAAIDIEGCTATSSDGDNDGTCDVYDFCPAFDNNLIGSPCDDGDVFSSGELYDVNCGCSGGRANLNYCAAAGSNGTGSDYINYVALNGVENSSGQTGYSDFRDVVIPLTVGEEYTLSASLGATFAPDRLYAWIDWDRNGSFDEAERVDLSIPQNNTGTATVSVPANATEGVTTMRVRVVYSTTFDEPCNNAFGEVEDYTIDVDCNGGACTILPLSWTDFTARSLGKNRALLNWATATEEGVDHFRVERSAEGFDFTEIGRLTATNTASAAYDFLDETATGNTAYYRITAVDLDESESTSPLRRVAWADDAETVRMYPNPAGTAGVHLSWDQEDATHYLLYNAQGQELRRQQLGTFGQLSGTAAAGAKQVVVATSDLPAGFYLLRVRGVDWDWVGSLVIR